MKLVEGLSITDPFLKEDLEDSSGLLVDETGDPLDAASPSQTTMDGRLGDALDVVPGNPSMMHGASLA